MLAALLLQGIAVPAASAGTERGQAVPTMSANAMDKRTLEALLAESGALYSSAFSDEANQSSAGSSEPSETVTTIPIGEVVPGEAGEAASGDSPEGPQEQQSEEDKGQPTEKAGEQSGEQTGDELTGQTQVDEIIGESPISVTDNVYSEQVSIAMPGLTLNGSSVMPAVSEDGRFVVFASEASNLVPNDNNGKEDVFLFDRESRITERISVTMDGGQANGRSFSPSISLDGTYVMFGSDAANLLPSDVTAGYGQSSLYVYNRISRAVEFVAVDIPGGGENENRPYDISANGRYVAFYSESPQGDATDKNRNWDVFIKDRQNGLITRISNNYNDFYGSSTPEYSLSMSPDGRFIAFESETDVYHPEIFTFTYNKTLYVYDRRGTTAVPQAAGYSKGNQYTRQSMQPSITPDGRHVAFVSNSGNLEEGEFGISRLYLLDRTETGAVEISAGTDGSYYSPSISSDGKTVLFTYVDTSEFQVYAYRKDTGVNELISEGPNGPGNNASRQPAVTKDGRFAVFVSNASNLTSEPQPRTPYRSVFFRKLTEQVSEPTEWSNEAVLHDVQHGGTYAALAWTPANGEGTVYAVYRKGPDGITLVDLTGETKLLVTGLDPGTSYTFEVVAGNGAYRFGERRLALDLTTDIAGDQTPPQPVFDVTSAPGQDYIDLNWKPAEAGIDTVAIEVRWKRADEGAYSRKQMLPFDARGASLQGLIAGTAYEIRIETIDADGNRSAPIIEAKSTLPGFAVGRLNVNAKGEQSIFDDEVYDNLTPDMDRTGQSFVFSSSAINLTDDYNSSAVKKATNIYVYDRRKNRLLLVTKDIVRFVDRDSDSPSISPDGRFIAFISNAGLTGAETVMMERSVYLYDRDADGNGVFDDIKGTRMRLIAEAEQGAEYTNPQVGTDAQGHAVVAFEKMNADYMAEPIQMYRAADDSLTEIDPVPADSEDIRSRRYTDLAVSEDGNLLTFNVTFTLPGIADEPSSDRQGIYTYDLRTKELIRLSGENQFDENPAMSPSGRYIAWLRTDETVSPDGGVVSSTGLYVWDRTTGEAVKAAAIEEDGYGRKPAVADNGTVLLDTTYGGDGAVQIYAYDKEGTERALLSRSAAGVPGDGNSSLPVISGDGSMASFVSEAGNLVSGDTNEETDVFYTEIGRTGSSDDSEPPVFPEEAKLQADNKGPESVTLTWPAATDNIGLKHYELLTDTGTGTSVSSRLIPSGATSAVVDGLRPDTEYRFTLTAVDAGGNHSLPLSVTAATTGAVLRLDSVKASAQLSRWGLASPGQPLTITLIGETGAEASAKITFRRATTNDTFEVTAVLSEVEGIPGKYVGTIDIPEDSSAVTEVTGRLQRDEDLSEKSQTSAIPIGGSLEFTLTGHTAQEFKDGSFALVSASKQLIASTVVTGNDGVGRLSGLPPADDYRFEFRTKEGRTALIEHNGDEKTGFIAIQTGIREQAQFTVTLPASLQGIVSHAGNKEADLQITVKKGETVVGTYRKSAQASGQAAFETFGLLEGDTVAVEVKPLTFGFRASSHTILIEQTPQKMTIPLEPLGTASLVGKVTDSSGKPIGRATVYVLQGEHFTEVRKQTVSADGSFTVSDLVEGRANVYAEGFDSRSEPIRSAVRTIELAAGTPNQAPLALAGSPLGSLKLNIYSKKVNQTETGPFALDANFFLHYPITFSHPLAKPYPDGNVMRLYANPGDTIEVCVDGGKMNAPTACGKAVMNAENQGEVNIRLYERDDVITTRIVSDAAGYGNGAVEARLYLIGDDGVKRLVDERVTGNTFVSNGGILAMNLDGPGSYSLELTLPRMAPVRRKTVNFVRIGGQPANLPEVIHIGPPGLFEGRTGNESLFLRTMVTPGMLSAVRTTFVNGGDLAADRAKLLLEVPEGTTYAEGSLVVNGQPALATREGRYLVVDLGTIAPGQEGTALYYVKVSSGAGTKPVSAFQKIRYGNGATEGIGTAATRIANLILEAPARTAQADIPVSGYAPAGSQVNVMFGGRQLGTATASGSGRWETQVTLPVDRPDDASVFWLHAETTSEGKRLNSKQLNVRYDPGMPVITNVRILNLGKSDHSFDPRKGLTTFPYVIKPGMPVDITVTFDRPEQVDGAELYIGASRYPMTKNEDGMFQARPHGNLRGSMAIAVDTKPAVVMEIPDDPEETMTADLPEAYRKIVWRRTDANLTESDSFRTASMAGKTVIGGIEMETNMNVSFQRVTNYQPSEHEEAQVTSTGVPVYGLTFQTRLHEDRFEFSIVAYIPENAFQAGTGRAMLGSEASWIKTIYNGIQKTGGGPFELFEMQDDLFDTLGNVDKLRKLEDLVNQAADRCEADWANRYMDWARQIGNRYLYTEIAKWIMMGAGAALGPETFGIATVLLFLATEAVEDRLDDIIDDQIKQLRDMMNSNPECKPEEVPEDSPSRPEPLADPKWIYDPSGIVYEVEKSNPVEGVTATVLYKDEPAGSWKVWDAAWYGQINPQLTDRSGAYAWDVPEGKWKVVFSKDGFNMAESEELTVLPPHFNVDVAMVSLLPASVLEMNATSEGIDIWLDRHAAVDSLAADSIVVTGEDGVVIDGTTTAVDEIEYEGGKVSKHIRFTPTDSSALTQGRSITVKMPKEGLLSYNRIPMASDVIKTLTVEEHLPAPAAVTNLTASPSAHDVAITWKDPASPYLQDIVIVWRKAGGEPVTATAAADQQFFSVSGLQPGERVDFEVAARARNGELSDSVKVSGTVLQQPVRPDFTAPMPVRDIALSREGNTMLVTWTANEFDPDLKGYRVVWSRTGDEAESTVEVGKDKNKINLTELAEGASYTVVVYVMDMVGNLSQGTSAIDETVDTAPPGDASGLQVVAVGTSIKVKWQDPGDSDLAHMRVYVRHEQEEWRTPAEVEKGVQSHVVAGLASGLYGIKVTSVDEKGNESAGVTVEAAVLPPSTAPLPEQITVHNHHQGTPDAITVSGLQPGDVVNVYDSEAGGSKLGTTVTAAGQSVAIVTVAQLGTGAGQVYVTVTNAGRTESARVAQTYDAEPQADTAAPVTKYRLTPIYGRTNAGILYIKGFTISLQATDQAGGSGVKTTQYRINGGVWITYTKPFEIMAGSARTVEYFSTDNAGNAETPFNKMDFAKGVFTGAGSY